MLGKSIQTIVKSVALMLAFGVGVACGDLEAALEKEECFGDEDCGSKLSCVAPDPNGLNPTGLGWCLEGSTCVPGEQPYCPCGLDPGSSMPLCQSPYEYNRFVMGTVACWDGADMATCLCLPPEVTCEYDPP